MISIGEMAKITGLTSRALRHYESIGLFIPAERGDNGYRYYSRKQLAFIEKIKKLKDLGFELSEIQEILSIDGEHLYERLNLQLKKVETELEVINHRRSEITRLLSIAEKIDSNESIGAEERGEFMQEIKNQLIEDLKLKSTKLTDEHLKYFERESSLYCTEDKRKFLGVLRKAAAFAQENNLTLGPGRGPSGGSLLLYSLGFTQLDPVHMDMLPERLPRDLIAVDIDVQFEGGQKFVDYCAEVSSGLKEGRLRAFKMPLLDIINRVQKKVGKIDFDSIDPDDESVLSPFRKGDISYIFMFDTTSSSIHNRLHQAPKLSTGETIKDFVVTLPVRRFRDLYNVQAVFRPSGMEMESRILRYRKAMIEGFSYPFLSKKLQHRLIPNYGRALYQEDFIRIVSEYTGWSLEDSNTYRYILGAGKKRFPKFDYEKRTAEFQEKASKEVVDLFFEEGPYSFNYSHLVSFMDLVKKTAVLKSQYPKEYLDEIKRSESEFGFSWDDFGYQSSGVTLMQS